MAQVEQVVIGDGEYSGKSTTVVGFIVDGADHDDATALLTRVAEGVEALIEEVGPEVKLILPMRGPGPNDDWLQAVGTVLEGMGIKELRVGR